jgi:hypothetical protein
LCVDAWAVQHPGEPSPQTIQSIAGHLLSLYSALVLDTPEQSCRDVIRRVTSRKGAYRWLTPPPFKGARTIVDISPTHVADDAHHWATDAWFAWRSHHGQVRTWYAELFAP